MTSAAFQAELQCPNCAGQCVYDPGLRALSCTSCGTAHPLETPQDAAAHAEYPFDPNAWDLEQPVRVPGHTHSCDTCGGTVNFMGQSISTRCAYCDGAVVRDVTDHAYEPMALIPFEVRERDAQLAAQDWVRRRFAAPNDLGGIVGRARVAGIYVPFWTFDSDEAIDYWAMRTVRRNKRSHTQKIRGAMRVTFDDLLVPASPHVTPLIRDGILHDFEPRRLRPYRAGYLAGFAAEQHHQTVREGLEANKADKALLIRNRIKAHIGKSGVHNINYNTDTTGIHYRRILLPVWILHYTYGGVAQKVVVCGLQGRTFGERPFSRWKLAGFAAVLSTLTVMLGLVWGASGIL